VVTNQGIITAFGLGILHRLEEGMSSFFGGGAEAHNIYHSLIKDLQKSIQLQYE
jgi:hypothetical protein